MSAARNNVQSVLDGHPTLVSILFVSLSMHQPSPMTISETILPWHRSRLRIPIDSPPPRISCKKTLTNALQVLAKRIYFPQPLSPNPLRVFDVMASCWANFRRTTGNPD
ncbi:hypothetical protein Pst134EA_004860 [Puccinia striiformis f. sp. tritici]|uniref:hypothetical protein n=1 Tax=Puccinia striiformis f. sp. tritici TaxID=168172 RepID=UPI002007ADB4|nr:hypothetical protein Pst134EA_004860 [Puccinia striiformis f. sp. tritici]KAH9470949.1 hypothetical protein Pst134EA_004860 [Puccinia striiformis f. sp. tritici]